MGLLGRICGKRRHRGGAAASAPLGIAPSRPYEGAGRTLIGDRRTYGAGGATARCTTLVCVSSSSSSGPYPNPWPEYLCGCAAPPGAPPNTALTFTVPTSSSRHARCAFACDGVSTTAASP